MAAAALWNGRIRGAASEGHYRKALMHYRRMRYWGISPDHLTFPFLLKACSRLLSTPPQMIHAHVLKSPFSSDVFVSTTLLHLYSNHRLPDHAHRLFDQMPHRDVVAWNALILSSSSSLHHHHSNAAIPADRRRPFLLFQSMRSEGVQPDSVTIITLTQSCCVDEDASLLRAVHSIGIRIGFFRHLSVSNTWIAAYARCQDLSSAESLFGDIPRDARSAVSWNAMIAGCAHLRRSDAAAAYFARMRTDGQTSPDLSTVLSLLSAFGHSQDLALGRAVHSLAVRAGFDSDVRASNAIVSLYSKSGDIRAARLCFDGMAERTCVSWTSIIAGYSKVGDVGEAMNLFRAMQNAGEKPDAVTVVAILSACGMAGSVEWGRWMEKYASGLADNVVVCNALIDMYAKCGCITDSRRVFEGMSSRSVVSWTALIAGCALNGDFKQALGLFSEMMLEQRSGMKPNCLTFLAVLQACAHGGLLERGREVFDMMARGVYGVEPSLEHYACMADLLGRKGELKEALRFIESMPMEPDCGVWGALLGSCITHHEAELGEYAATRLLELNPSAAVPHVAMANIYASKQRWDGVASARVMMRSKGLKKSPGKSILHVNGQAHSFLVDDRVHPQASIIYQVLDQLALHLKLEEE